MHPCINEASPLRQDDAVDALAAWMQRLSTAFTVCLGDLGSVVPADPVSRPQPALEVVNAHGLSVVSLWYRAPEICLGDVCFSCPVDIWALGCVFAEVLVAAPVYEAHSVVSLIFKVFSALGAPEPGGYLTELPLYSKTSAPRFQAQFGGLPCDGVQGLCPELAGMLKGFSCWTRGAVGPPGTEQPAITLVISVADCP